MNRKINRIQVLLCCILGVNISVWSQTSVQINDPTIRTWVLQYADAQNVQRPFLVMENGRVDGKDESNTFLCSFDQMSHDVHLYTYMIQHLDADGEVSQLSSFDYLQGFTTHDITDYATSLNTSREYTHYWFTFPNEDMVLTKSGLYRLQVYEDGNPNRVVVSAQFMVVEPKVGIQAQVRPNTQIELNGRYQQLDIDVDIQAMDLRDPKEIKLVVQQNGRMDNAVRVDYPTFVEGQRLRYINQRALIFEGGNEYHHLDAFSTYMAGNHIDRILFDRNDYHAILFADPARGCGARYAGETITEKTGTPYIHEDDANGQFLINAERTQDAQTEAEYMWVHWTLQSDQPWLDGIVYVGGDLFQNRCSVANRMEFDAESHCYFLTALLKQGGYDYQYWFVPKGKKEASVMRTEGSHWQTDNEYTVLVYYHPFGARYDQLIGIQQLTSH